MIGSASAPGSSGNLGPGFDTLAIAISLRCSATAQQADAMTMTQDGVTSPVDTDDIIHKIVLAAVGRPMHLTLSNEIPRARGLGSSGAVMSAVAAAAIVASGRDVVRQEVFEMVSTLEQHPDNAAASVFGGLVVANEVHVKRLKVHDSLKLVVGIPDVMLKTSDARIALPDSVSMPAVARTIARVSFLVAGLTDGDVDALKQAGSDEVHEQQRSSLSPVTGEVIRAALRAGAAHACWSGSGPSVLAISTSANVGRVIGAMGGALGPTGEVLALRPDYDGLSVEQPTT